MSNGLGWVYLFLFAGFLVYIGYSKPDCRAGFVPAMGFGSGWYCAAGYKPARD